MSYKVNLDGSIECATAQEALNLQTLIRQRTAHSNGNGNGAGQPKPARAEPRVLSGLGCEFLRALLERPQTAKEAAEQIGSKVGSFPPMYRGLRKRAKDTGFDYDQLIVRTPGTHGDVLSINAGLRSIVEGAVK